MVFVRENLLKWMIWDWGTSMETSMEVISLVDRFETEVSAQLEAEVAALDDEAITEVTAN